MAGQREPAIGTDSEIWFYAAAPLPPRKASNQHLQLGLTRVLVARQPPPHPPEEASDDLDRSPTLSSSTEPYRLPCGDMQQRVRQARNVSSFLLPHRWSCSSRATWRQGWPRDLRESVHLSRRGWPHRWRCSHRNHHLRMGPQQRGFAFEARRESEAWCNHCIPAHGREGLSDRCEWKSHRRRSFRTGSYDDGNGDCLFAAREEIPLLRDNNWARPLHHRSELRLNCLDGIRSSLSRPARTRCQPHRRAPAMTATAT